MWGDPASRQLVDKRPSSSEDRPARERRNLHSSVELPGLGGAETGQPRLQNLNSEACISLLFTFSPEIQVSLLPGKFLPACLNVHF